MRSGRLIFYIIYSMIEKYVLPVLHNCDSQQSFADVLDRHDDPQLSLSATEWDLKEEGAC